MQKINVALCSFGMSGLVFHAPFINIHAGFVLYGVWERSAKKAGDIFPGIKSFDTLEDMLADPAIDLVIVNTPNYTHFNFAQKALLAGKHVMVEKAFTVNAGEARELVDMAKKKNKKLAVFQNRRYDSDLKTVKKVLDERLLHEIVEAEFHFDRYNLALSPKAHKETNNPGAGLLHDLGPHLIDQAIYLFGMPDKVSGFTRITRPMSVVNDYVDIMLYYPGLSVRLKAGLIVKEPQPSFIIHGTNGSFLKPRGDVQEDTLKAGRQPTGDDWGTEPESAKGLLNFSRNGEQVREYLVSEKGNYMELYDRLWHSITEDTDVPVSGEDGWKVMKIIDAVLESEKTGKVVEPV